MESKALSATTAIATKQIRELLLKRAYLGEVLIGTVLGPHSQGIPDLLSALARVRERHSAVRLIIVGDSSARASLELRASDLGIAEYVVFAGEQQDFAAWVAAFDIFALPMVEDAFPTALQEAMAAGKAVVSTATRRLRALITDGKTGRLVAPGDVEGFAKCLETLIEKSDERRTLGSQAARYATKMYGGSLFAGRANYGYAREGPPSRLRHMVKQLITAALPKRWLMWHGRRDRPQFALTFDDGPDPMFTPRILDILREHKVCATFFLVGNRAEEHPDIVQRIGEEGHEIGNHSYSHPRFQRLTFDAAVEEVGGAARILEQSHHCGPLFRPPFGRLSPQSIMAAWKTGHRIAMFNVDLKDYRANHPSEVIAKLGERGIVNGDIILYHGTNENSLAALPWVIERARHGGRKDMTVSNLNT